MGIKGTACKQTGVLVCKQRVRLPGYVMHILYQLTRLAPAATVAVVRRVLAAVNSSAERVGQQFSAGRPKLCKGSGANALSRRRD